MSNFVIGDVVQLNSGGPKMTVNCIIGSEGNSKVHEHIAKQQGLGDGDVIAEWFDGNEKKTGFFKKETIKKA